MSGVDDTAQDRPPTFDPDLRPKAEQRLRDSPPEDDPKTLEERERAPARAPRAPDRARDAERRAAAHAGAAGGLRERYVDLYDGAAAGYLTLDPDGRVLDANLPAAALLGVERDSLTGRPLSEFVAHEDQDEYYLHRRRLLKGGASRDVSRLRLARRDGERLWVRVEAVAVPCDHGDEVCARVAMNDISAQKAAEIAAQDAKTLLDRVGAIARAGGWEYDVAAGKVTWTDEVYRSTGWIATSTSTIVDRLIGFCTPGPSDPRGGVRRAVEEGQALNVDVEISRTDGERRWVHTGGRAVVEDGVVVAVLGTVMDSSERKEPRSPLLTSTTCSRSGCCSARRSSRPPTRNSRRSCTRPRTTCVRRCAPSTASAR